MTSSAEVVVFQSGWLAWGRDTQCIVGQILNVSQGVYLQLEVSKGRPCLLEYIFDCLVSCVRLQAFEAYLSDYFPVQSLVGQSRVELALIVDHFSNLTRGRR